MHKFVITYLCHRGINGHENIYPEKHYIESENINPAWVYREITHYGGFSVDGLLCRRWIPVSAIISVDTEHGK